MNAICSRRAIAALIFVLVASLSGPAQAERGRHDRGGQQELAPPAAEQRRISIQQAIASVQQATGGRILDARDQGDRYRIKVLTQRGEVRVVHVDARSGELR